MEKWIWEEEAPMDEGRLNRARKVKVDHMEGQGVECVGAFIGSSGELYRTTLASCTCADFAIKGCTVPCKHILRLAMEAGIINEKGNTPAQQRRADRESIRGKIAVAYGYYYHFKEPVMTDREYDGLKARLSELEVQE